MKLSKILLSIFFSIAVFFMITAFSETLTLSGTITNDHPDLSWNSVSGAEIYLLKRLPVPATGYQQKDFKLEQTSYLDQEVTVISQTGGFCQIRYVVEAYTDTTLSTLLATSNNIDYINDCL